MATLDHQFHEATASSGPSLGERWFASICVIVTSGAILPVLAGKPNEAGGVSSPASRLALLSCYGIAGWLLLKHGKHRSHPPVSSLWLLPSLALVSAAWSDVPLATLNKASGLVGLTLIGTYLAYRFPIADLLSVLRSALSFCLILSIIAALLLPSMGTAIDSRGSAWTGVFVTKNVLARMAVLSALVYAVSAYHDQKRRAANLVMALLSLLVNFHASSRTSTLALLASGLVFIYFVYYRRLNDLRVPYAILGALTGFGIARTLMLNVDQVAVAVGRDPTLTGRSELWSAVWEKIQIHPYRGYGFGAFWRGFEGPSAEVWRRVNFAAPHAHNGALDALLDLGIFGLALLVGTLLFTAVRAETAWRLGDVTGLWTLTFLGFYLAYNITESTAFMGTFWVLLAYSSVYHAQVTRAGKPNST